MLLSNYTINNANPGREIGGYTQPFSARKAATIQNFYSGNHVVTGQTDKSSWNNGYGVGYAWALAPKGGGLSSNTLINGTSTFVAAGAMGVNGVSAMSASGTLTATLQLVVSAVAALSGSGTLTGSINAPLNMAASLAASGNLVGSLKALGNAVAAMTANGSMDMTITAIGHMEADILPYTELSPESLAASVWNSVAAQFNAPGTMGEKMNDAGNGGAHPNLLNTETGDLIIPLD